MKSSLVSLINSGTKIWLDSIDPKLVESNRILGATGATSNPVIIADLLKTGRFDKSLAALIKQGRNDSEIAWAMTDRLVTDAQDVFYEVWKETQGNDGYVSFELDPLLEDPENEIPHGQRVDRYVELGKSWSDGHDNRMIKVPATPAGIDALEPLAAAGVTLNVTLIFSDRQYEQARRQIWQGAQQLKSRDYFKSVYSIFVSRVDVYTKQHVPNLSDESQGQVGILNAKRIWLQNQQFWNQHQLPLQQEMIFASTGTKDPNDDPCKYVVAFAGSDIETNPPATNDAVVQSGHTFNKQIDQLPDAHVIREIDAKVDFEKMEEVLMREGIEKFATPQKSLLDLIRKKRESLSEVST